MQATQQNLFTRDDTFFGVCEALGEDFRIPPNLLRVALALLFFWNPTAVVAGYFAVGILVALTRWIAPNPRSAAGHRRTGTGGAGRAEQVADEAVSDTGSELVEELAAAA